MFHALRHRDQRWLAWAISLIVLLGALAPTVSRWLHHGGAGAMTPLALLEVCVTREGGPSSIVLLRQAWAASATGLVDLRSVAASNTSNERSVPIGDLHLDHCPFCLIQGDGHGMAPPPVHAISLPSAPLSEAVPTLFLHAPRPMHAWAVALARAPPLLSA